MIGTTVSHYSAPQNPSHGRNPRKRDKMLEHLGGARPNDPGEGTVL